MLSSQMHSIPRSSTSHPRNPRRVFTLPITHYSVADFTCNFYISQGVITTGPAKSNLLMPIQNTTQGAAIEVRGLARIYRMGESEIRAVNDVSFSIGGGEFVALLGTSGSGKSSL